MLGAQLMIILDMTVVNIALPHIQNSLHFSATGLSWVLNGYTLTSGGLLLLGGRAGDILGRRRMFIAGITLFTLASLAGGLATTPGVLLAARALQGVGGAFASPAVLALVVTSFPEGRERTRALGIYMGVITGGSSLGLVLGGVITEWLSWRWVLFINVPIGLAVLAVTPRFVAETPRLPGRFDLAGALTATAGVTTLVYGFIRAAADGWGNRLALAAFGAAAVLLALFVVTETRARQPITPMRLFTDVSRAGSFIARLLLIAGMFGMFFFLTQFLQKIMGFSPLRAGAGVPADDLRPVRGVPAGAEAHAAAGREAADDHRDGARDRVDGLAVPGVAGDELLVGRVRPDAADRPRDGAGVRAADHRVAGRRARGRLRRRVGAGEHAPAGRRARSAWPCWWPCSARRAGTRPARRRSPTAWEPRSASPRCLTWAACWSSSP